jgi:hypothetical protein
MVSACDWLRTTVADLEDGTCHSAKQNIATARANPKT